MHTQATGFFRSWRALLLLAIIPALTNCSRIDGSVELNNSSGEPYSFEGAKVEVFDLNQSAVLAGETKTPRGLGSVDGDGAISAQVITATIEDDALYDVEIQCPANNTADACNVESPLHVALSGAQLIAGGWKANALTEAALQNTAYYAAANYSVAEIQQMLDIYAHALLVAESSGSSKNYQNLLEWNPALTQQVRRPGMLNTVSTSLANGIDNSGMKQLARQWVSPTVATMALPKADERSIAFHIAAAKGYAYIGGLNTGLKIVDVHDSEHPVLVGQTNTTTLQGNITWDQMELAGNYVYALSEGTLRSIDVSNPKKPKVKGSAFTDYDVSNFTVSGNLIYASGGDVYIISTGDNPSILSHMTYATSLGGDDSSLCVVINGVGAELYQRSNVAPQKLMSKLTEYVTQCTLSAGHAYISFVAPDQSAWFGIYDIHDLATPKLLAKLPLGTSDDFNFTLSGTRIYTNGRPASIIDVSDPAAPILLSQLPPIYSYAVPAEPQIYAVGRSALSIVDISDPVAPLMKGTFEASFINETQVATADGFLYVVNDNTLTILDPDLMTLANVHTGYLALEPGEQGYITAVGENFAYLLSSAFYNGVSILDISNPAEPTLSSHYSPYAGLNSLDVNGNYAILSDRFTSDLHVADVSNPAEPVLLDNVLRLGQFGSEAGLGRIVRDGDYVYALWGTDFDYGGQGCTNQHNQVAGGLFVVDVHALSALATTGRICLPGKPHAVAVNGNRAYAAIEGGLLQVIDVSNHTQPTLSGSVNLSTQANFVAASGNYVWATEGEKGIEIIDASNPAIPTVVASIDTAGEASYVNFDGPYAYVADSSGGILIFDVTAPTAPKLVASLNTTTPARTVTRIGDYLYTTTFAGVEVFKALPANLK